MSVVPVSHEREKQTFSRESQRPAVGQQPSDFSVSGNIASKTEDVGNF
jgi:hypothetical protein